LNDPNEAELNQVQTENEEAEMRAEI